jgi:prefoldin subunit 5
MSDALDKEVALLKARVGDHHERLRDVRQTLDAHRHTIAQIPRLQDDAAAAVARTHRIDVIEQKMETFGIDLASVKASLEKVESALDTLRETGNKRELRWVRWRAGTSIVSSTGAALQGLFGG